MSGFLHMVSDLNGNRHLDFAQIVCDGSTTVPQLLTVATAAVEAVGVQNGGGYERLRGLGSWEPLRHLFLLASFFARNFEDTESDLGSYLLRQLLLRHMAILLPLLMGPKRTVDLLRKPRCLLDLLTLPRKGCEPLSL